MMKVQAQGCMDPTALWKSQGRTNVELGKVKRDGRNQLHLEIEINYFVLKLSFDY